MRATKTPAAGPRCSECGAPMTVRREAYRYEECGLRYVTLKGIEVSRCGACGNFEVSIPRVEQLHQLIAERVIEKRTRFTGAEIRFLRQSLGLSGALFARRMGVAAETVSRWENDAVMIGGQADRLLRLLVAQGRLMTRYPAEKLDAIEDKKPSETRLRLTLNERSWSVAAA